MDIIALLEAKGLDYENKSGDEIAIVCPNSFQHRGGYDDRPSFNINIVKGVGHCFACGFQLGAAGMYSWLMGEEVDEFILKGLAIKSALKRLQGLSASPLVRMQTEFFFPNGVEWQEDGYRGISLETYQKLDAIKVNRGRYENRICFPVWVKGELVGVDARYLGNDKEDKVAKYLRNKDSSCKENWLYPYDLVKAQKPSLLLLGEGIFHAINTVDKGYTGLCFFGVNNFSLNKVMLMVALGAEEVCYFPDPDKAGYQAMQRVCAALLPWFKVTVAIPVYDEEAEKQPDLGDYTQEQLDFCVANRVKVKLPLCLQEGYPPQNPVETCEPWQRKIVYAEKCKVFRCYFNCRGECNNEIFKKDEVE